MSPIVLASPHRGDQIGQVLATEAGVSVVWAWACPRITCLKRGRFAYTLMEALWRLALRGTALAEATRATLRTNLGKVGAVGVPKLTIMRLHLSSHHPLRDLFGRARALARADLISPALLPAPQ